MIDVSKVWNVPTFCNRVVQVDVGKCGGYLSGTEELGQKGDAFLHPYLAQCAHLGFHLPQGSTL